MKKKFSFVLAILMVVCTLSIALVACAPKDPEAFTAAAKGKAYGQIWDAWVKSNGYQNGDKLGVDLKIDAKNTKDTTITDLTILLQAGLDGVSGSENEAIRLAVIDNNKKDDIIDMAVNKDGLYFDALGMEKSLLFPELALPNLGVGESGTVNGTLNSVKDILVGVVMTMIGTDVTIDPKMGENKLYDVEYTFGLDFTTILALLSDPEGITDLIGSAIPKELTGIIEQVLPLVSDALDGLEVDFKVTTTGNEREKVEKPAKGDPKYDYVGGTLKSISAVGSKGEYALNISFDGLKLNNTLPTISVPAESEVVKASLLKHDIQGNIVMKDADDNIVASYSYVIRIDFTATDLLVMIKDSVANQNANTLLDTIIKSDSAKLFVELYHECGDACKINHLGGKKDTNEGNSTSIFSIAYSPEAFDNNRIYVSLDMKTILPADILAAVAGINDATVNTMVASMFKNLQYRFSFDIFDYLDLVAFRNETSTANAQVASMSSLAAIMGVDEEIENPFSIENMITSIISGLQTDQNLQLKMSDIKGLVDMLANEVPELSGAKDTIIKALDSLFPNTETLIIDAVYTNGLTIEENVYELFIKDKNFGTDHNTKLIKGNVTEWEKDAQGNAKIYQGETGKAHANIYEEDGKYKPVSADILRETVVRSLSDFKGGTVKVKVPTFEDAEPQEMYMNIASIVGLNPNVYNTPQNVKLVLCSGEGRNGKATIGSSINYVIFGLPGILNLASSIGFDMSAVLDIVNNLVVPEIIIPTTITLTEVESVVWDQSKVAGIKEEQIFDENKELYANGDPLKAVHHLIITYKNGYVTETDVNATTTKGLIKSDKVDAWDTFTLNFNAYGYSKDITVKMDKSLGEDEQTIELTLGEDGTIKHQFGKWQTNAKTGTNRSFTEPLANNVINQINSKYSSCQAAIYTTSGLFGPTYAGMEVVFTEVGTYEFTIVCETLDSIKYTIKVSEAPEITPEA